MASLVRDESGDVVSDGIEKCILVASESARMDCVIAMGVVAIVLDVNWVGTKSIVDVMWLRWN